MPLSVGQFVEQLTGSGLLSADDVASVQTSSAATDAEQLARALVKEKRLTAYQAQQAYAGRAKALVLGNYVVLDKLGQGGMGMVLKAQHRRMNRLVALKVLSPALTKTETVIARFHREVQAAARLEHPNIVVAYDADEAHGTHFFVMQYVDGQDLSSLVKRKGTLPVEQAVNCVVQAARGLQYAHAHGVIHRDIKPANLLWDSSGVVKILDMGLARIEGDTGAQAEITNTGAVMGTVDYMAPEQARNTKAADARSDIYALGITLWYLLVGKPAYEGATITERLLAHQTDPIPSLCAVRSEVPTSLDAVFQKMIAKRPADRYQTMTDVLAALEACQRGDAPAMAPSLPAAPSDDSQFNAFLAGLVHPESGPRGGQPKPGTATVATADSSPTLSGAVPEIATDPQLSPQRSAIRRSSGARRPWWQDRRVQLGGGAVILLAGVLFLAIPRKPAVEPPMQSADEEITATNPQPSTAVPLVEPGPSLTDRIAAMGDWAIPNYSEWRDVFNGRDLSGWTGDTAAFTVRNGVLEATGRNAQIVTERTFRDFEAELEFRQPTGAHCNFGFRCPPAGVNYGMMVVLSARPPRKDDAKQACGALLGLVAPAEWTERYWPEWNRLQVSYLQSKLVITLNGTVVVDVNVKQLQQENRKNSGFGAAGPLGFMLYTPGSEFRNVRVRDATWGTSPP